MRILLTGRNGQVGWELERALAPLGEVTATDRAMLDLADTDAIRRVVRDVKPEVIVNAAAYTAVDKAESEPALAYAINATAPGVLAEEAKRVGALLVHYSTDYVFDGTKLTPYVEEDEPNPLNVYGASKLAGERSIQASGCRHLILRTSWVYGVRGRNFLLTILRLAKERPELQVVDDQFGAPTAALAIARGSSMVLRAVRDDATSDGLFHMTAAGSATWCEFARSIVALSRLNTPVRPIASGDFVTAARRPRNSLLDNSRLHGVFNVSLPDWHIGLEDLLCRGAGR